ncbi:interleukin-6 receptor subunit beta-like [Silurus asotus]|uniref:Interleukin-6 receptor subunit beta-like n=1 Tax=Silurus asotus TaxID=30991 RepID=A0AAD5FKP6_SILAS|nr:interleukin-6 receptor subunit beta-like [Silurus asotus]
MMAGRQNRALMLPFVTLHLAWLFPHDPPPYCLIPFYDEGDNLHCHWRGLFNPLIPTNFTLHWKMEVKDGQIHSKDFEENESGIIERDLYETHEIIKVWVTAANRLGTVDSEMLITNTKSFIQPATPSINKHSSDPLEITWDVSEDTEQFAQCQCKVQYKKLCDKDWTERVSDEKSVMSDWSSEYTVETPAAAPIGTLDVWSDCDSTSDETGCTVLWKEMPLQQARGKINNYVVTMKLANGSVWNLNESFYTSAETCVHRGLDNVEKEQSYRVSHAQQNYLRCPQEQERSCFHYFHLSIPVKEVNVIEVTANTTGGKSNPALVALPRTGQLTNYTAYNVSLFAVVNNRSCLLKSAIAYSVEGVPSEVTDFQAIPTSPYTVNLTWTPIPLNKSHGHIIQYFVGLHDDEVQGCATASGPQQVHNVSSNKRSFQISNLNPGQQYAVWISTKTSAGEGKRTTACFTTPSGIFSLSTVTLVIDANQIVVCN